MKLSVSVPDDLWDQARDRSSDEVAGAPSALVQEALRSYVSASAPESPRLKVVRPQGQDRNYKQALLKLAAQARLEAEKGYVAGVTLAEQLDWHDLEQLAEHYRFDVEAWARSYRAAAERYDMRNQGIKIEPMNEARPREPLMRQLMVTLGNFASPHDMESWIPAPTYLRGLRQALAEVWQDAMDIANTADQL